MRKPVDRSTILDAASVVAQRDGASRLTIEAVAREVGLSKAGLLYSFPSKDALMTALLQRMIEQLDSDPCCDLEPDDGSPLPIAQIRRKLATYRRLLSDNTHLAHAVLIAGTQNPELLDPLRAHIREHLRPTLEGVTNPVDALLILTALDGMLLQHLLDLPPADPDLRGQMLARIEQLITQLEIRS